jgi:integrase
MYRSVVFAPGSFATHCYRVIKESKRVTNRVAGASSTERRSEETMGVYKQPKSNNWSYKFTWNGEPIRKSTKQTNKRVAEQMEAAHRTQLAKGEVGIHEKKCVPTLKEFASRFEKAIDTLNADKPATISFYKEKLKRLLNYGPFAAAPLDTIDEAMIEAYKQHRSTVVSRYKKPLSPASINRELATLRRLLRLAQEWKIIDRVPRIRMLKGERQREFVLNHKDEPVYIETCPQPLQDVAVLILDTGMRPGEACGLQWSNVHLEPAINARFGYVHIAGGKSRYAKRNLSLSSRVSEMLRRRKGETTSNWVFSSETGGPALGTSLDHQHDNVRTVLKLQEDFVIHSLRHTMLTRLGEAGADAFTIMRIAGHSSVTVSQRYVHPTPESLEQAFKRLEDLNAQKFEDAAADQLSKNVVGMVSGIPARKRVSEISRKILK